MRSIDASSRAASGLFCRVMIRQRLDRRPYPDAAKLALARALRRNATPAERHAWTLLRNSRILGLKFRRQHVLDGFIVDFYCPALRLVLELDGAPHRDPAQADYDAARTEWLLARGYRVMRLSNREICRARLEELLSPLIVPPLPTGRGGQGERYP